MKRIYAIVTAVAAALIFAGAAHAQAPAPAQTQTQVQAQIFAVRVCAKDPVALAKFYEAAFGMSETQRLESPLGVEVVLNFGATVDAAKANKSAPIVISQHASDDPKDPTAHLIFFVADETATIAAIKAAGGAVVSEPVAVGTKGYVVGLATDPVGNRVEVLHHP
jgi:predicted enzyme related to lactoylglutathione lyase